MAIFRNLRVNLRGMQANLKMAHFLTVESRYSGTAGNFSWKLTLVSMIKELIYGWTLSVLIIDFVLSK